VRFIPHGIVVPGIDGNGGVCLLLQGGGLIELVFTLLPDGEILCHGATGAGNMAGLAGDSGGMVVVGDVHPLVRLVAVAVAAGHTHPVTCPVVRVVSRRYPVVFGLVTVNTGHPPGGMHVIFPGERKAALDEHAPPCRLVADHAVLHLRLADGERRLSAPILSHHHPPLVILERFPQAEVVVA